MVSAVKQIELFTLMWLHSVELTRMQKEKRHQDLTSIFTIKETDVDFKHNVLLMQEMIFVFYTTVKISSITAL